MQFGSTNMLDQLLGGFETQPTGPTGANGVTAGPNATGLFFGDLLNIALQPTLENELGQYLPFDNSFPSLDQPSNSLNTAPAGPTVSNQPLPLLIEEAALHSDLPTPILSVPTAEQMERAQAALISDQAGEESVSETGSKPLWRDQMPQLTPPSRQQLQMLLNGQANLATGEYKILNQQIVDGRVELTLESPDTKADPIKISLPIDALGATEEPVEKPTDLKLPKRQTRGELLAGKTTSKQTISKLLPQLNLKAIRIDGPAPTAESTPTEAKPVVLLADHNGHTIELKVRQAIVPLNVRAEATDKNGLKTETSADGKPIIADARLEDSPRPVTSLAMNPRPKQFGHQVRFDLGEQIMAKGETVLPDSELNSFSNISGWTKTSATTQITKELAPAVKMVLPEQIHKPFAASGQSIMIKIQPDHLGPARLNLTLHEQVLSARVTVDTPLAKAAVENSLHQLTDQLSRAGIDVDRIEVSLSDRNQHGNFFERRPNWSQSQPKARYEDENEPTQDSIGHQPTIETLAPGYIRSQGVDLLA